MDNSGPDPRFKDYHLQASYVLTGGSRDYTDKVFRGIIPTRIEGFSAKEPLN